MSPETIGQVLVTLVVFVALLIGLVALKRRGTNFTPRVFIALAAGLVLGGGIQLFLGLKTDATTTALDWISIVGKGYIALLKMLIIPLIFVSIVNAFTHAKVTDKFGKISGVVMAVLLGTVAIAALFGWAVIAFSGLAGASFTQTAAQNTMTALQAKQQTVEGLTLPQVIVSFIPPNIFADLAGSRANSTVGVVVFSVICGVAWLKLRERNAEQAEFFKNFVDSLNGIVMRIVSMVMDLTPYGILALMANVMATSDFAAVIDLGKLVLVSYVALIGMFLVHLVILAVQGVSPATYVRKTFPVLSFAFVSHTSAGCMPFNIETQTKALGVDEASANLSASLGVSIGQNGCAGIYPAMLATIIAPTVGIDVLSPAFVLSLVAVVVISSFGISGVGGGATFASLVVLGTLNLPIGIVGVLASVEMIIDMGRTALNVSDAMVAGVTASNACKDLDRSVLADPKAIVDVEAKAKTA